MKRDFISKSILLRKTRYKDNLYILSIFSEKEGLVDARARTSLNGKISPSILESMNLLELTFNKTRHPEYFEITGASLLVSPSSKNPSVFLLLNVISEICLKTLHKFSPEPEKFKLLEEYILQTSAWKNKIPGGTLLFFLRDWTRASGIMPSGKLYEEEKYFSIHEGRFISTHISDGLTLNKELSEIMNDFIRFGIFNQSHENILTDIWIQYIQYHISELRTLKSIEVIKEFKYSL